MNNQQNEKMGKFICELRKNLSLTQKDLAARLNVTDKAVSKWERGISCPDVLLVIPLADVLGVTASELLNGQKEDHQEEAGPKAAKTTKIAETTIVEEALLYSRRSNILKSKRVKKILFLAIDATFLIAAMACLITDFCLTSSLTWSLLVVVSLVFGWFLVLPIFTAKSKLIKKMFIVLSVGIWPYLLVLSWLLDLPIIFQLGASIAFISLLWLWWSYAIYCRLWRRNFLATGWILVLAIPMSLGIDYLTAYFCQADTNNFAEAIIDVMSMIALVIIFFGIDYWLKQKTK